MSNTANHTSIHGNAGWVLGFASFAAVVMVISGIFQFFEGLAAIMRQNYFVATQNYAFYLSSTTWGWINLILGALVAIAGFNIFSGSSWARVVGIVLSVMSAVSSFFYIPYSPIWSLLVIALDIGVIFALSDYTHSEA